MFRQLTKAGLAGLLLASSLAAHAAAQESHAWLDPKLLAAAKAEGGTMTIYSSTNEGEGLPLWALFTKATGIKVNYVRGADSILISRMMLEYRGNQKSWDIAQTATINKMLPQLLVKFDPPEAKNIMPEARDPGKLWYGVYANYNTPDYNTQHVKAADLPKTYEDFAKHPEWAGHVAIDGTDNEWLKAMFEYYGDDKATKIVKDIVATVKPIVTNGHLAAARSVGSGEYWLALNNFLNLTINVKMSGAPTDYWLLNPVVLIFGAVGINVLAPHPNAARLAENFVLSHEAQILITTKGRFPTRPEVPTNPPEVGQQLKLMKIVPVVFDGTEHRKWQKTFNELFGRN